MTSAPPIPRDELAPHWQRAFAWVEKTVGGELTHWASQGRWRPAWFLDVTRPGGEHVPLYWRGARSEFHGDTGPLLREQQVIEVLARHGIPVPHPYGLCEDPPGLLLHRMPGTFNLATEPDEAKRRAALDHYLELLARIHAIPVEEFEAIGLRRPADGARSCLGEMPHFERGYRAANFLLPKGKASIATEARINELEHHRRIIAEEQAKLLKDLEAVRSKVESTVIEVEMQAGTEGKLFGSVTMQQVAELLAEKGLELDRRKMHVDEPIKTTGEHTVQVRLHREMVASLKVQVTASGVVVPDADEEDEDTGADDAPTFGEAASDDED